MSEAKQTAKLALEALEDKKAMDVRILDITHVSTLADYFMIASGSNRNQVQAMADNVEEVLGKAGVHPKQKKKRLCKLGGKRRRKSGTVQRKADGFSAPFWCLERI